MLPSRCQVCGRWPARAVCDGCARAFARRAPHCVRCALPCPDGQAVCGACLLHPPRLAACVAAVDYGYPWAGLLQRFKFHDQPAWARHLADPMRAAPGAAALLAAADQVLPVPLTAARLARRGYNQAWELVKALRPTHARADGLLKLRELPEQHTLDRAQRLRNARLAFACHPAALATLQGRRLLLVDDVMTTGATLEAAAEVLLVAGAARVDALVFARTLPPGPDL